MDYEIIYLHCCLLNTVSNLYRPHRKAQLVIGANVYGWANVVGFGLVNFRPALVYSSLGD